MIRTTKEKMLEARITRLEKKLANEGVALTEDFDDDYNLNYDPDDYEPTYDLDEKEPEDTWVFDPDNVEDYLAHRDQATNKSQKDFMVNSRVLPKLGFKPSGSDNRGDCYTKVINGLPITIKLSKWGTSRLVIAPKAGTEIDTQATIDALADAGLISSNKIRGRVSPDTEAVYTWIAYNAWRRWSNDSMDLEPVIFSKSVIESTVNGMLKVLKRKLVAAHAECSISDVLKNLVFKRA